MDGALRSVLEAGATQPSVEAGAIQLSIETGTPQPSVEQDTSSQCAIFSEQSVDNPLLHLYQSYSGVWAMTSQQDLSFSINNP